MTLKQAADTLHALGCGATAVGNTVAATAYWDAERIVRMIPVEVK